MENANFSLGMLWGKSSESLRGKWGYSVLVCFLQGMITSAGGWFAILLFPVTVGMNLYFLLTVRNQNTDLMLLFRPFNQYGRMLWGGIRVGLITFCWTLLFIVPGIIAGLRYAMTFYIMLDQPYISPKEAMQKSAEMMYGYKWKLFGYQFLFSLLLFFTLILTLGIGLLWLNPFMQTFYANFYLAVKGEAKDLLNEQSAEETNLLQ